MKITIEVDERGATMASPAVMIAEAARGDATDAGGPPAHLVEALGAHAPSGPYGRNGGMEATDAGPVPAELTAAMPPAGGPMIVRSAEAGPTDGGSLFEPHP